jgi:hypothetical protein
MNNIKKIKKKIKLKNKKKNKKEFEIQKQISIILRDYRN